MNNKTYTSYLKIKDYIFEITCDDEFLLSIERVTEIKEEKTNELTKEVSRQLEDYFIGNLKEFKADLLLSGTNFQKEVCHELLQIPYGTTLTYQDIANKLGKPKGARAIANAIARNRILIIIPCHRVIGSNGKLTGFRGGLDLKEYLLNLENSN